MRLFCQIPSIDIALINLLKSCMEYRCIYSTLIRSKLLGSFPYWLAARMHLAILPAAGRPAAMGQLFPACTGMSDYSRRGREASGPPLVISKYSPASARTSSSAPLCPPAPPALGRIPLGHDVVQASVKDFDHVS